MAITYLKFAYLKCVDLKLKKKYLNIKKPCKQEWPWYLSMQTRMAMVFIHANKNGHGIYQSLFYFNSLHFS